MMNEKEIENNCFNIPDSVISTLYFDTSDIKNLTNIRHKVYIRKQSTEESSPKCNFTFRSNELFLLLR